MESTALVLAQRSLEKTCGGEETLQCEDSYERRQASRAPAMRKRTRSPNSTATNTNLRRGACAVVSHCTGTVASKPTRRNTSHHCPLPSESNHSDAKRVRIAASRTLQTSSETETWIIRP